MTNDKKNQTVLVTGMGYLGSVIANLLVANDYNVIGVDNYMRPMSDFNFYLNRFDNYQFHKVDIRSDKMKEVLKGVDFIIHTAALSGEPLCAGNPTEAWSVNYGATLDLFENKEQHTKVIFHSTGSVYGKVDGICTETSPTNPLSIYAQTKLECEQDILEFSKNDAIIYRFSTAYGLSGLMRTNLLLNDLAYQAVQGKDLTIFQADFRRSFIHTTDVADAILAGIDHFDEMKGEIYNVGSKEGLWSKRQAAEYIRTITGCVVNYANDGYKDPDQRDYEVSVEKIKPFWEAKTTMEKGMKELIKGLRTLHEVSKFK